MSTPQDPQQPPVAPVVRRRRPEGPREEPARRGRPAARDEGVPQRRPSPRDPGNRQQGPGGTPSEEYVPLPPPTSGGRRLLAVGGMAVLLVGLLVGGVLIWGSRQIDPGGDPGDPVEELVIPTGSSTDAIGTLLAEEGIISNARLFRWYVGWQDAGPWNAGTYIDFRLDSSFDDAIEVLDAGPVPTAAQVVRVTEGNRVSDALIQISEQLPHLGVEQLQEALDSGQVTSRYKPPEAASWEGLLFPDTYQFDEDVPAPFVLQTMADKMDNVLDSLDYDKAEVLQGRTAYELVTIASLIEKETGQPPEERGMISRVISNRLDSGETLGIDATILYGLGRSSGELTRSDLETETPYNSRLVTGLPPTPISLVSEASLAAAIDPTPGDWRFYVLTSNDPPSHFFTDSYNEFLAARDDARERGVF